MGESKQHKRIYYRTIATLISWSDSTIKTLIIRLTKKGYIQIDDRKKPFHYSATISEKAQLDQETDVLLDQVCHKQNGNLLHTLIDKATLSQDDIQDLMNALKEKSALLQPLLHVTAYQSM